MKHLNPKSREGNILIESIVSISLVLIGLLGIFSLLSSSIRQNKNAHLKTAAAYLAAEGLEISKNIVDTDVADPEVPWDNTFGNLDFETFEVQYDTTRETIIPLGGATSSEKLSVNSESGLFSYNTEENETPSPFSRTIVVNRNESEPDELVIQSVVEWTERGAEKRVTLETVFSAWRGE